MPHTNYPHITGEGGPYILTVKSTGQLDFCYTDDLLSPEGATAMPKSEPNPYGGKAHHEGSSTGRLAKMNMG